MTGVARRHPAVSWTGLTLAAGGVLIIIANAGITPFMNLRAPLELAAGTSLFLWRQVISVLCTLCVLIGTVGIYLWQVERAPRAATAAFVVSFVGTALLTAWEWTNVFVIRTLALRAPDALRLLEVEQGFTLYDLGAMLPLLTFVFGWCMSAVCIMWTTPRLRVAASLVIAGLILTPLLAPVLTLRFSGAVGNAVLGAGWIWLGWDLYTATAAEGNTAERKALRVRR
jgi:hypothetical protein